jgi:hypothetical protein
MHFTQGFQGDVGQPSEMLKNTGATILDTTLEIIPGNIAK